MSASSPLAARRASASALVVANSLGPAALTPIADTWTTRLTPACAQAANRASGAATWMRCRSSRRLCWKAPTQFTTASMPASSGIHCSGVTSGMEVGHEPLRVGEAPARRRDAAPRADELMAIAMQPRQDGRADQAIRSGHQDAHRITSQLVHFEVVTRRQSF